MKPLRVAITGAGGFLGSALVRHFAARGSEVRALVRPATRLDPSLPIASVHDFEMPDTLDPGGLEGAGVVIHCAHQTRIASASDGDRINRQGSLRLFEACGRSAVPRIVYVSSMSVHDEALSTYARDKRALERSLDPARHLVVRPGHILGTGGVFWRAVRLIDRLPAVPLFYGGGQLLQTIGIDDVCRGFAGAVDRDLVGTLRLAAPEPIPLRWLYRRIAERLGRRRLFVPVPGAPVLLGVRALERLGVPCPITSDNLLGMRQLKVVDTAPDNRRLGFVPAGTEESLAAIDWSSEIRS